MFLLFILLIVSVSLHAEEVTGPAQIIDGDSISIGETEIRLHGIDAPEAKQMCRLKGKDWACGKASTETLSFLLLGHSVRCTWTERDRYDRALATCFRKDTNLNDMMVGVGMALAYRKYSDTYVEQEEAARAANRGLWEAEFIPPWEWRRGVRLAGNELPDIDCPVKGNVNRKGNKIYHVKGWRDHAEVRLKAEEGDQCFQSVFDAEMAGFRPAQQ
jgi:endonuclease YncB( thermonuclease family)